MDFKVGDQIIMTKSANTEYGITRACLLCTSDAADD